MKPNNEELDGKRHRVTYRNENLYVGIFPDNKEIFISSVNQDQDPLTGAALDAMSRLVTMAWKGNPTEAIVDQLQKASRKKSDLPGIISDLLTSSEDV